MSMKALNILSEQPPELSGPAFALTESAAKHIQGLMVREKAAKPEVTMLRIGVKGGGCSGLSYFMEFVPASEPRDELFDYFGVQLCIDPKSLKVLRGTTLDYGQKISGAGFQWLNPNQKKACGCGESFAV